MRGSSGAVFNFLGDRVVKLAPTKVTGDRIMAQGTWLKQHASSATPTVFQVYARSYVMERLDVPPLWALDHLVVLNQMWLRLQTHVWSQSAEVKLDHSTLINKYSALCEAYELRDVCADLNTLYVKIIWDDLRRCLTHGDPTLDNVMFRSTESSSGDLVIADPIPASPAVPDLWCVDTGKILQSALGWEEIRYGSRLFKLRAGTMDVSRFITDRNEWRATAFWAAIHILRTFPYVSSELHDKLKERIGAAVRLGL